jgi:hypothetical protein
MLKVLIELAPLIQVGMLVFAIGMFVSQARATKELAESHDARLRALEESGARVSVVVESAARTIALVEARLHEHIESSPCEANTVTLGFVKDELALLRRRRQQETDG